MPDDEQPEFGPDFFRALPERPDVVAVVSSPHFSIPKEPKLFRHTGKNLIKRLKAAPDLALQICWALRSGASARAVAIRFSVSPNSVVAVRESLRERGELEAVAKRVDSILDRFIELASERIEEGILMNEVHPGQLPIPLMAAIDKRSQRDAGMVLGTERTQGEALLANLDSAWQAARKLATLDSESNAQRSEVVVHQSCYSLAVDVDTVSDTSAAGEEQVSGATGPAGAGGAEAVAGAKTGSKAGGGDREFPGRREGRCDGPENFTT